MNNLTAFFDQQEIIPIKDDNSRQISAIRHQYRQALPAISLQLSLLAQNYQRRYNFQSIVSLQYRLKSRQSIISKLSAQRLEATEENIRSQILDIAGYRIICPCRQDIYRVAEGLLRQKDISLIKLRDYIKHPKANGYRSLHLVVLIPVDNSEERLPIEIQLRTRAMDIWAELEHDLCYKAKQAPHRQLGKFFKTCAGQMALIDEISDRTQHGGIVSPAQNQNYFLPMQDCSKPLL